MNFRENCSQTKYLRASKLYLSQMNDANGMPIYRLNYLSNKIFHAQIVPPIYINPPYIFDTGC